MNPPSLDLARPLILALALAGVTRLAAQADPTTDGPPRPDANGAIAAVPPAPIVPIHTAAADLGFEYGIWAAGDRYKVSFHDGLTFVPMLGRDYPQNQPVAWTTTSVRHGAVELVTHAPRLSHGDTRAEYDLGDVVEAYDLRRDGVEQTFVVAQPHGVGDLVVRGRLDSQLRTGEAAPAHRPLELCDVRGRHLVTYGAATAVDASGRTFAMTTAHEHGEVTLRLPASWLEQAVFPVTVDPLLGPSNYLTGPELAEIDVVRDPESNTDPVWICYTNYTSSVDLDVRMYRWSNDGQQIDNAFFDITSTWSSQGPRCAFNGAADRAIMVFDRLFQGGGGRWLRFHTHDRSDFNNSTIVTGIPSTGHAWRCDVGGTELHFGGPVALVVWQQENGSSGPFQTSNSSDIFGCIVDVATNTAGTAFPIANAPLFDNARPSVNQFSVGTTAQWVVAYQLIANVFGIDDWDIAVRQVDGNGSVSAAVQIDDGSPDHKLTPRIEGLGGRYLVAFVTSTQAQQPGAPGTSTGHQLRVARLNWQAGGSPDLHWGTSLLESSNDPRIELGGLAYDRTTASHWAVTFRSTVTENVYLRSVGYRGRQLLAETVVAPGGSIESIAGAVCYDELGEQFVVAYGLSNSPAIGNAVRFDRFTHNAAPPWSTSGIACSPATITWVGSQQIGSELGYLRAIGAANDSLHVMAMATAPAAQVLVGIPLFQSGCWLLIPNVGPDFVGVFGLQVGANAVYFLPLPEFLNTQTYYFQDFHTVGNGDLTLLSTQRLVLPTVK